MRKKKNVIITLHGIEINDPKQYRISKYVIKKAQVLICVSEGIETIVKKRVPKTPTYVLPCAVRDQFFVERRKVEDDKAIKIAFPASKDRPEKNYPFFQQIIDSIEKERGVNVEVIEIHGKSRSEVCETLNTVDILVMTSISEGSPQIIKEAMCCNLPIVSSNVGNIAILLKDVENCKVIDCFDKQSFINGIDEILNCRPEKRRSNGREKILALGLDEKNTCKKLFYIYKKLQNVD
jgi:glycosyltransferase involved in cell wall biosynthesis